ncbi:MAG: cytochrome b/b6 domain-containing protein [Synechococcaceae cyanobacterium]|nr:cytochrome b/b6 domain-containing protein [Synechococcaceae cyanobacterium]
MARPYQPSLLRLLHGVTALLVPLAWLSGLAVYSRYDGRWGRPPVPPWGDWIDIHGTVGVLLWPAAALFGLYALSLGRRRLSHPANAAALLGLALAVGSGKLMQENWLRDGQWHHPVYSLHLLAWLVIAGAVLGHVGGVLGRGGVPLARSMFSLAARADDRPRHWPRQVRRFFAKGS